MWRIKLCILTLFSVVAFGYDLGAITKYSYETTTTLDEDCKAENEVKIVGHRLTAKVHLTSVWQNPQNSDQELIKIEVLNPKLWVPKKSSFVEYESELDKLSSKPSFILREKGSVSNIWDDSVENLALRNLKRGIASLLEVKKKEKEVDVSGSCDVIYEVDKNNIRKRKSNCFHSKFDKSLSQPYGVRSMSTQHLLSTDCLLLDEKSTTLSKCSAVEYVKTFSNMWRKPSLCVNAKSQLTLEGTSKGTDVYSNKSIKEVIEELKKSVSNTLVEDDLEALLPSQLQKSKNNLAENVKKYQDSLKNENLAKLKSALAFYKLLPSFRSASKEDIVKILQSKKFKPIQGQILDLIAASSNEDSLKAAFEYFADVTDYDEMLERFLISLSIIAKPKEYVMEEIKNFLDSKTRHEKIYATLITTLGAVLKTYGRRYDIANNQVLEDYRAYLEKKVGECTDNKCISTILRGLRNAGFVRSLPLLVEYALKGGKPALEAVLAIRSVDDTDQVHLKSSENKLLNVFLQVGSKQDRSTRAIAAEILFDLKPNTEVLKGILNALSDQSDPEFATFLTAKIFKKASEDEEFKSRIFRLLPEKYISFYYSTSQKGSSSLFRKPLINSAEVNISYGIQMEMLEGNLLKRSVFDVNFEEPELSNLLTVGMFGEGLASLAGGEEEEGATLQAGMELTLLGSSLRPYIFFTGTSELMGHAWSGTASTPTPALQGIFSFSDDEKLIVLHNGMTTQMQLRGVLSTDLSASVQISLWSQNSQSQVANAAALLMRGAVTVESGFSSLQGAYQFSGQSAVNFNTDLVFSSSPFQMCLKMEHPDITIKHDSHRSLSVSGSKYILKKTKRRKREIPRKSYALHERNNEQCRQLN